MSNNKGLSLVEVIVSIAILSIIAVAFLTSVTSHYVWLVDTKTNITQAAFTSQEAMEGNINLIKRELQSINPGESIDSSRFDEFGISENVGEIKLFQGDFSDSNRVYPEAYLVESSTGGSREFVTLVGDARLPELPVPEIEFKSLVLRRNGADASSELDTYEYHDYDTLTLSGSVEMVESNNCFLRNKHEWYVSNPGFLIPIPPDDYLLEDELGALYPAFPRDYEPIPLSDDINSIFNSELSDSVVRQHPGRHIIYTVTPYATSLKRGTMVWGSPAYIMGPNHTENLLLHFDASTVFIDYSDDPSDDYFLERWKNLRPSTGNPNIDFDAIQDNAGERPIFSASSFGPVIPFQGEGSDEDERVWGRSLGSRRDNNTVASMEIPDIVLGDDGFTLFLVMRMVATDMSGPIIEGIDNEYGWSLEWVNSSDSPKLAFRSSYTPSGNEGLENILDEVLDVNGWHIIKVVVNESSDKDETSTIDLKAYSLHKNSEDALIEEVNGESFHISSEGMTLNWEGVELSELLIYSESLSGTYSSEIIEFLIDNKYNPNP